MTMPKVGDGATVSFWSDRKAATVIDVSASGRKITVQEDTSTRTDTNGMSDAQSYDYSPNPDGRIYVATLRKDGKYRVSGMSARVSFAGRSTYHDYSF